MKKKQQQNLSEITVHRIEFCKLETEILTAILFVLILLTPINLNLYA